MSCGVNLIFKVEQISRSLKKENQHRKITGVLIDLHVSALALTLQLLELRKNHAQQLYHDRRRDIRHDTQSEYRCLAERAAREHVEQLHQATAGETLHRSQLIRIDTRKDHIAAHPVYQYQ